jgi:ABC-type nitrate/sulfonate/bicarbonate transport system permease component
MSEPAGDPPLPAAARRSRRLARWLADYAPPALLLLVLALLWEVLTRLLDVPDWLLPAPSQILSTLIESLPVLRGHVVVTLQETLLGLGLALVGGLSLGLAIDASPLLRRVCYPLLVASQTIPIVAVAPLLIIWLGFGMLSKIMVVVLITFFPIVVNTVDGLRAADRDMLRLLQAMNASRWQLMRLVRLPAALPAIFSGIKLAVTYSVIGAVLAEWIGAEAGLGVYIARSLRAFRADQVFVGALVTSLLTIALFFVTLTIERWLIAWRNESS